MNSMIQIYDLLMISIAAVASIFEALRTTMPRPTVCVSPLAKYNMC